MYILYHYPLCPFSRQVRVLLREKDLVYELKQENYWERTRELAEINPAMTVPVLTSTDGLAIADIASIYEYLEEIYPDRNFLGHDPLMRAEVRRLTNWFNGKFNNEVTSYIIKEKIIKSYTKHGEPSSTVIRAAKSNIYYHMDYIAFLLQHNTWLAGEDLTLADFAASSHLSVLDYLGDVPWQYNEQVKEWYSIIKSRPSFRPLLHDNINWFNPVKHYSDLDF